MSIIMEALSNLPYMAQLGILALMGLISGIVNVAAGGGSLLTLPALLLLGIPPQIANATNRINIIFQNATSTYRFQRHKLIDFKEWLLLAPFTIAGAIVGALIADKSSDTTFRIALGVILLMLTITFFLPKKYKKINLPTWIQVIIFFGFGVYGGFAQVGIGLMLLPTILLFRNHDLLHANALKVSLITGIAAISLILFSINTPIAWIEGGVLAFGSIIGAFIGTHIAMRRSQKFIQVILVAMLILTALQLFGII